MHRCRMATLEVVVTLQQRDPVQFIDLVIGKLADTQNSIRSLNFDHIADVFRVAVYYSSSVRLDTVI